MADERKVLAHSAEQIDEAVEKVLDGTVATKTDLQNKADLGEDGKVPESQLPEMDYASSTHAIQHASGGSDPITPAAIGAAPAYTYGTEDLTAGTSTLETGKLYFVYE